MHGVLLRTLLGVILSVLPIGQPASHIIRFGRARSLPATAPAAPLRLVPYGSRGGKATEPRSQVASNQGGWWWKS